MLTEPVKLVVEDHRRHPADPNDNTVPSGYAITRTINGQNTYYWRDTENNCYTVPIPNTPGVELPATGGSGSAAYMGMGAAMIALAVLAFVLRREQKKDG
ncbi:MAG: LPXTG cell wall anchor domain-containing protein [Clostridia bacterium]|nr:LPXTG cell wall anchor domain-containing protein [Clostridia bacterium]